LCEGIFFSPGHAFAGVQKGNKKKIEKDEREKHKNDLRCG
jgi:hypothetical protein